MSRKRTTGATVPRPLEIITSSNVVTCIRWWTTCRVDGTSVVLAGSREDENSQAVLVVANLRSAAEASAFFRTLNERVLLKAHVFDAREWPGLANDPVTDNSAGGG